MLRYITMFVLVMTMVKTNAQGQIMGTQSNDIMLVRLSLSATQQDVISMQNKVLNDPDFSTTGDGTDGYFFLTKDPQSTISNQQAIANYLAEPYVGSASFVYMDNGGHFHATTYDVLLRGKNGVTQAQISNAATPLGMLQMDVVIEEMNIYILYFDKNTDIFQVCDDLEQTGLIEYAGPNEVHEYVPFSFGNHTASIQDCPVVRPPVTNDDFMINFRQWGLYTGTSVEFNSNIMPSNAIEFSDINVCHAWQFQNGSASSPKEVAGYSQMLNRPIYVAVLDDGIDTRHDDLNIRRYSNGVSAYGCDAAQRTNPNSNLPRGNPIYSPNLPNDEGCPDQGSFAYTQHGTIVGGIISAKRNNLLNAWNPYWGMVGVAYKSELMPVKIAWQNDPNKDEYLMDNYGIIYGFKWAAEEGADILNCSWGWPETSHSVNILGTSAKLIEDAITFVTTYGRDYVPNVNQPGRGSVVVFATGNNNDFHIAWPSSNSEVIAVGGYSMCHERKSPTSCDGQSGGSNYGDGLTQYYYGTPPIELNTDNRLSVVGPGTNQYSTLHSNQHTATWQYYSGTSFAAPYASGVAALMLSVNSCLTYKEVKDLMEISAEAIQPDPANPLYTYTQDPNNPIKFWNNEVGHGKLNAGDAVTLAHDLYLQRKVETGTETYHASHYIFAGDIVTDIIPSTFPITLGYTVQSGADVNFYVRNGQGIVLTDGFTAQYGSNFLADPDVNISCDNSHHHHKPAKTKTNPENNAPGKQPILSSSDNLLHGIKVYPNPAKEAINIEFMLEEDADVSFTLLNLLGQKMKETEAIGFAKGTQRQQVSLDGLAPGVYFVGVKTPSGYTQFRFIKE